MKKPRVDRIPGRIEWLEPRRICEPCEGRCEILFQFFNRCAKNLRIDGVRIRASGPGHAVGGFLPMVMASLFKLRFRLVDEWLVALGVEGGQLFNRTFLSPAAQTAYAQAKTLEKANEAAGRKEASATYDNSSDKTDRHDLGGGDWFLNGIVLVFGLPLPSTITGTTNNPRPATLAEAQAKSRAQITVAGAV